MSAPKMIVIFLNNKLISLDTTIPVFYEIFKKNPKQKILFYCFERNTFDAIRRNIVLYDVVTEIGSIKIFSGKNENYFFRKFVFLGRLFFLILLSLFKQTSFVHFKALSVWPLKILGIVNLKKTFLFGNTSAGHTNIEEAVNNVDRKRVILKHKPNARYLVGFYENWRQFQFDDNYKKMLVQVPLSRNSWNDYININSLKYFELSKINFNSRYIVYILCSLDNPNFLRKSVTWVDLLEETIAIIDKALPGTQIVLKPHPATTKFYLNTIDKIINKNKHVKIIISDIHPMTLTKNAICYIANASSSTFINPIFKGVPTVEYSDYLEESLIVTNGESMREDLVSYFINRDLEKCISTLRVLKKHQVYSDKSVFTVAGEILNSRDKSKEFDALVDKLI